MIGPSLGRTQTVQAIDGMAWPWLRCDERGGEGLGRSECLLLAPGSGRGHVRAGLSFSSAVASVPSDSTFSVSPARSVLPFAVLHRSVDPWVSCVSGSCYTVLVLRTC